MYPSSSTPESTAFSSTETSTTVCGTTGQCLTPATCMDLGKSGLSQPDDIPKSPYPTASVDNALGHAVGSLRGPIIAGWLAIVVIGIVCATLVCSWKNRCRSRSRCSQECDGLTKYTIDPFTARDNIPKDESHNGICQSWSSTSEEIKRIQDTFTSSREHRIPLLQNPSAGSSTSDTQSAEIGSPITHRTNSYVQERSSRVHCGDIEDSYGSSVQSSAPGSHPSLISSGITHIAIKGEQLIRSNRRLNPNNVEEPPPVYQLNANRLRLTSCNPGRKSSLQLATAIYD